jgi:zinc protease
VGPDRSHPPEITPPVLRDLAEPETHTVGSARVQHLQVEGIRKVAIGIVLGRGSADLADHPDEISTALASLVGTATKVHTAAEVGALEDVDQIQSSTWIDPTSGTLWITVPKDRVADAFSLVHEFLAQPKFPGADVKRWIRDRQVYLTQDGPSSLSAIADSTLTYGWYPADSAWGARPDLDEVDNVRTKDVVQRMQGWTSASPIDAVVVGDVPWSAVEPLAKTAFDGLAASGQRNPDPPYTSLAKTRVVAVDMPGQAQVAIRMRTTAPLRDDPDRMTAWTVGWALGGSFFSRLNMNLRENKGYTYGASAWYYNAPTRGVFTLSVDVDQKYVAASVVEVDAELQALVDEGVSPEELTSAWRAAASGWNDTLANADTAGNMYYRAMYDGDTIAAVRSRIERVKSVAPADTARVAARYFGAEVPRLWVVVGDRTAIEGQLASLGWTPEWVAPEEAFLGNF